MSHNDTKAAKKVGEPSRVRVGGRRVTNAAQAENPAQARIDAFRKIVQEKSYSIIDGVTVDLFTASAVVKVYDALNEQNRAKFAACSVVKMVAITWKVLKQ